MISDQSIERLHRKGAYSIENQSLVSIFDVLRVLNHAIWHSNLTR
jgi:hypothetical protein